MEELCKDRRSSLNSPTVELSAIAQLPENTHCVACSEDGCYLCVGHSRGLMVLSASSCGAVAEWEQDRLDVCSVQMTAVAEMSYYLLGAVDDMGVARLFALYSKAIHLVCVLNIMEEINKRSICLSLDILEGGQCGAALFSCKGASWLEVFQFPLEAWHKDLEMRQSPKQESNSSENVDVRCSPVSSLMKIQPPKIHEATSTEGKDLDSPLEHLQGSDFSAHWLALDVIRSSSYHQETLSHSSPQGTNETSKSTRCTQHFLLSCSDFTVDCKTGLPVAIGLWWSGSHNFLQYFLQKAPKRIQNAEQMPDVVWPNQYPILCSAVSTCTRYVALGLGEASVCVWDRKLGAPLSILVVPEVSSSFFRMQFVDHCHRTGDFFQSMCAQEVHLTVLCKSGAIHTISTGQGIKPCSRQLEKRLKHGRDIPVTMTSVPFLRGLMIVVLMTGKMFLQDVINRKMVCVVTPPPTHVITTPCNPVYALSNKQQTLFIRGDQRITGSGSSESQSHLFVLRFGENDIIKQYIGSLTDFPTECL